MNNTLIIKKKYTGCYSVINVIAKDKINNCLSDIQIAHSIDNKGKWVIEGTGTTEYDSKKIAIDYIKNNWLDDFELVWLDNIEINKKLEDHKKWLKNIKL